jgi:hypothetical protein
LSTHWSVLIEESIRAVLLEGERIVSTLVSGIFSNRESAEQAVSRLYDAGYAPEDVSILMSDNTHGREFAVQKSSKAPEGAATGAALGGVLGAAAAGFAALGTLTVPGLSLAASGPLVAALTGLGAGAAAGGVTGALVGLGIPEHEAKFYKQEIERGGILVGVYAHNDRKQEARKILEDSGASETS